MTELDLRRLEAITDRLIAGHDRRDSPGVSVGLVQNGALVLHRSAGMASIELGVSVGPDTVFRIASVSKQFTCAAILMLAAEGKLSVDDQVQRYFPDMPKYEAPVTLDHLMHNNSGIRDMLQCMAMGGCDLAMPIKLADLRDSIVRQRTLNFTPGTRYLYSNSNFFLLGLIVEQVTGSKLADFLTARIFAPLGMNRTAMVESTTAIVPGLATAYLPDGAGFRRAQHAYPIHGEGALVSSVGDLALWHRNYETGLVGGAGLRDALEAQSIFPTGVPNHYARGLTISDVRGLRTVSHGGLWPGYVTEFLRIPALATGIVVIANNGAAVPYRIGQSLLAALLDGEAKIYPLPARPDNLGAYVGRFIDPVAPQTIDFTLSPDGGLLGNQFGAPGPFKPMPDGRMAAARSAPDFTCRLIDGGAALEVEEDAGIIRRWDRVQDEAPLPADLDGIYESDEMAATWVITDDAVRVDGPVVRGAVWALEPLAPDLVRVLVPGTLMQSWMDAKIIRDTSGKITGLLVNGGRVKQLALQRVVGAG